MSVNDFLSNLRSNKIFSSLSIFAASSWIIIQVLATVRPYLKFPEYWVTAVIYTIIFLIPLLIFNLWVVHYDPQPENIRLNKFYDRVRKWDANLVSKFVTIGLLFAFSLALNKRSSVEDFKSIEFDLQDNLAVLYFENQTGDEEFDVIGPMVSHWLTEGFIQNGDVKIVSANAVQRAYTTNNLGSQGVNSALNFTKILGTKFVIDGSYFKQRDSIFLKSNLVNVENGQIVYAFGEFSGHKDAPIEIIENLREKVLGYWYTKEDINRFPAPRYDAYRKYIEAIQIWSEDENRVEQLLNESIALDENFMEPQFLLIALNRNKRNWEYCDSIVKKIDQEKTKLTKAQSGKLKFFKLELQGDFKSAYKYLDEEYKRDPNDLFMNTSVMQFANYKLNAPDHCLDVSKTISLDSIDMDDCKYCKTRLFNFALAKLNKSDFDDFFKLQNFESKIDPDQKFREIQLFGYVRKKDNIGLEKYLNDILAQADDVRIAQYYSLIATAYLMNNDQEKFEVYKAKLSEQLKFLDEESNFSAEVKALGFEIVGNYEESTRIFEIFHDVYPDDRYFGYRLAGSYALSGEREKAWNLVQELSAIKVKHDFGYKEYETARVHAILGETKEAMSYLQRSVRKGRQFHYLFFHRDWYLQSLWKNPEFESLLKSRIPDVKEN